MVVRVTTRVEVSLTVLADNADVRITVVVEICAGKVRIMVVVEVRAGGVIIFPGGVVVLNTVLVVGVQ